MTVATVLASLLATVDVDDIVSDARALIDDGATEAEVEALISALIDAAVPEELAGAWADAAMEPLYEDAARKLLKLVMARLARKVKVKGGRTPAPLVAAYRALARGLEVQGKQVPAWVSAALAVA